MTIRVIFFAKKIFKFFWCFSYDGPQKYNLNVLSPIIGARRTTDRRLPVHYAFRCHEHEYATIEAICLLHCGWNCWVDDRKWVKSPTIALEDPSFGSK
jgi:hypothetical protein